MKSNCPQCEAEIEFDVDEAPIEPCEECGCSVERMQAAWHERRDQYLTDRLDIEAD